MTIRGKLILWYSGLLALIIIVMGVSVFLVTRWTLINSVDTALNDTVDQVLDHSSAELVREFGSPARIVIFLPQLEVFRVSGVIVQVWDVSAEPTLLRVSSNAAVYSEPLDPSTLHVDRSQFRDARDENVTQFYTFVNSAAGILRVLTRPLDIWGHPVVIQAATSYETINYATRGLVVIITASVGMALVGSIGIGLLLAERALKPIDNVTRAAEQIAAADDLKTRLDYHGPKDEIGRLVHVFNQMMQRLESLFSVQQRFVADVSHELRTPLTAIRGHVDLIKRYGMDPDSLEAIESEAERMSRMVSDLLLLARADYGGLALNLEPLDLDVIVSEVFREARVLAKDRDMKITVLDYEPVRVNGDADRLKQLLFNLVSNALKFTPDGGEITINLRKTDTDAIIEVQDTGIGIAPEDLSRVFDRFYQAEPSRVRKGEGAGLGLSIARWIAEAHHGRITVESQLGMGTTFTVTIPHIEERPPTPHSAVTRTRLSLRRRSSQPPVPPQKSKP